MRWLINCLPSNPVAGSGTPQPWKFDLYDSGDGLDNRVILFYLSFTLGA